MIKTINWDNFLLVQCLRLHASNAALTPGWGTKIPPATGWLRPCTATRETPYPRAHRAKNQKQPKKHNKLITINSAESFNHIYFSDRHETFFSAGKMISSKRDRNNHLHVSGIIWKGLWLWVSLLKIQKLY